MHGHPSISQARYGHLLNSLKLFAIKDHCRYVHFLQTRFASDVPECVLRQAHDYPAAQNPRTLERHCVRSKSPKETRGLREGKEENNIFPDEVSLICPRYFFLPGPFNSPSLM